MRCELQNAAKEKSQTPRHTYAMQTQTLATPRRARLISAAVAADLLGVSVCTIRRRAHDGTLPAVRLGEKGWLRFRRDDVEAFISGKPR